MTTMTANEPEQRRWFNRNRLKQFLSLLGATIILLTFIAKDARKDKLKELADSIQTAKNTFNIQEDHQNLYRSLTGFEGMFRAFAEHPTQPLKGRVSSSGSTVPNWEWLEEAHNESLDSRQQLVNVSRLREKLSVTGKQKADVNSLLGQLDDVDKKLRDMVDRFNAAEEQHRPADIVRQNNEDLSKLSEHLDELSGEADDASRLVLATAEQELRADEHQSDRWTLRYYVLFALGWVVTVIGILIGEPDEKSVVEEIVEA
jgi:hypothetical protein